MTHNESDIARLIGEKIRSVDPGAEVYLFGSHARGEAQEESDWDVLILIDKPKKSRQIEEVYRDAIFQVEMKIGVPISLFIYSKNDWEYRLSKTPLYQNIKEEGVKIS
ncbi:MAG: nucleotidyltransferase domain-containing protein [Bacteroidales bacterium]|nr:nucleotidyltransferase domain-containing protein [Bacteroidales bacterium]